MKLIVILFFIFGVCSVVYLFLTYLFIHFKELKKVNWFAFTVSGLIGLTMIGLISIAIYTGSKRSDKWCNTKHYTNAYPPQELVSSMDYFEKGNYEYDKGNCDQALNDYSISIELNGNYPQAYNNRAYTFMRLEDYESAIEDLNKALELDPNYLHALRNRADVNSYKLGNKSKAVKDYEKIIELAGPSTDVCAHLADSIKISRNPLTTLWLTINCTKR